MKISAVIFTICEQKVKKKVVNTMITWYNNSVKKRGDNQKGIKKDLTSNASND